VIETDSDFDGVVSGCPSRPAFEEKDGSLERDGFMHEGLIDKMGEEGGCGMADNLITKKNCK